MPTMNKEMFSNEYSKYIFVYHKMFVFTSSLLKIIKES
jgi:hypothetical protein